MERPVFITYDNDRRLLGIFEEQGDSLYNSRRYNLFSNGVHYKI